MSTLQPPGSLKHPAILLSENFGFKVWEFAMSHHAYEISITNLLLFVIFLYFENVLCRLQDRTEIAQLAVIPRDDSPFWEVCSKSLVATAASHITLTLAVPRAAIDADFISTLTGRLGAMTVMNASTANIEGRQVVALLAKDKTTLKTLMVENPNLWWSLSYYIISMPKYDKEFKWICRSLWDRYRVRYIIFVMGSSNHHVATYNPFIDESTGGHLSMFEATEFSFVTEDYIQLLNLHKLPIRITMFPSPPTAIPKPNGGYDGCDGVILKTAAKRMNFTPIITRPSDGEVFGVRNPNGTFSGALKDILSEKSDIAFNGHFIQDYQTKKIDFTTYVTQNRVCFIVPKAGFRPRVMTILNCFDRTLWIYVIVFYFFSITLLYIWSLFGKRIAEPDSYSPQQMFLYSFKMFLYIAPNWFPRMDSGRILAISIMFVSFVIVNEFEGVFLMFLNRPVRYKDIDTLEELGKSGLAIKTTFTKVDSTLNADPSMEDIVKNLEVVEWNSQQDDVGIVAKSLSQEKEIGGMMKVDEYKSKYFRDFIRINSSQALHTVQQCPLSYFLAYILPLGSPFLDSFNTIIARCVTAGLVARWDWDANKVTANKGDMRSLKRGDDDEPYTSFTLSDLYFAFIVYLGGTTLSIVVYIIELIIYNFYLKRPDTDVFGRRIKKRNILYWDEFPSVKKSQLIQTPLEKLSRGH